MVVEEGVPTWASIRSRTPEFSVTVYMSLHCHPGGTKNVMSGRAGEQKGFALVFAAFAKCHCDEMERTGIVGVVARDILAESCSVLTWGIHCRTAGPARRAIGHE
jgi:hypothetical protein